MDLRIGESIVSFSRDLVSIGASSNIYNWFWTAGEIGTALALETRWVS